MTMSMRRPESSATMDAPEMHKRAAFRTVLVELQRSKEEAGEFKEKARHLELAVTRLEAWLARTRRSLADERSESARLRSKLPPKVADDVNSRPPCSDTESAQSRESSGIAIRPSPKTENATEKQAEQTSASSKTGTLLVDSAASGGGGGVTFETHELLIREVVRLRDQLTLLAREKGQSVDGILEAAEYKEMIEKLQEDIQDREEEKEWLVERLRELCEKESVPASELVQLKFKNEKLEKRLFLSQRILDTLSKRCEELKDELEMAGGQRSERWPEEPRPKIKGEFHYRPVHSVPTTNSVDEGIYSRGSIDQTDSCKTEHELSDSKFKDLIASNQQLQRDRQEAERQREVFEQRYNNLMETLQDIQDGQRQCSKCRRLEQDLGKARQELTDLKDMNELIKAQMKLNEEELMQEQQELVSQKQKNSFHMEQWKKNCQLMSQQVDLLMGDLKKEREVSQGLRAQLKENRGRSSTNRQAFNLAANFSSGQCSSPVTQAAGYRMGPTTMPALPLGRGHEIECDGPGGFDDTDGRGGRQPASSPGRMSRRGNTTPPGSEGKVEWRDCPCCQRSFPLDRNEEFEVHVNKCLDNA